MGDIKKDSSGIAYLTKHTVGYRFVQPHKGALHSRQPTAIQTNDSFGIVGRPSQSVINLAHLYNLLTYIIYSPIYLLTYIFTHLYLLTYNL